MAVGKSVIKRGINYEGLCIKVDDGVASGHPQPSANVSQPQPPRKRIDFKLPTSSENSNVSIGNSFNSKFQLCDSFSVLNKHFFLCCVVMPAKKES